MSEVIIGLEALALIVAIMYHFREDKNAKEIIKQQNEELELLRQQRRELIETYYPPLAENLRHSIENLHPHMRGEEGFYEDFFEILDRMKDDSTLKIIEALDNDLYSNLVRLKEELNLLDIFQAEKRKSFEKIPTLWANWMKENINELPKMRGYVEEFTSTLWAIGELWKGEDANAQARLKDSCDRFLGSDDNTLALRRMLFTEFKQITIDHWFYLRVNFSNTNTAIRQLVNHDILPRMDETLRPARTRNVKGMHHQFSSEMKDFLVRLGLSVRNAPGSWSVIWELSKASEDPNFHWLHPEIYQAIKTEIISLQFLSLGTLIVGAVYLQPEHSVEIKDRPVDLSAYVRGEKKIFYRFRLGENVLYYAVTTSPRREGLAAVLKARDVLDHLVKGNMKSDYLPYLPESHLVELVVERFGMEWVRCRHLEYYNGDQRFRCVSIYGQLLEPGLHMQVFLFDKQKSIDWLRSQAREIPEDDKTVFQRIIYRVQGRKLLVFKKDLTVRGGVKSEYDITSYLAELSEILKDEEFDLSSISVARYHGLDPDFVWSYMLRARAF